MTVTTLEPGVAAGVLAVLRQLGPAGFEDDDDLAGAASLLAQELPRPLRERLLAFRRDDDGPGFLVLRGVPVPVPAGAPTPAAPRAPAELDEADRLVLLLASLLGDVVGWRSHQAGRLVQDVVPLPGSEDRQLGSGSRRRLELHTEGAFSDTGPDWLLLLGVRNGAGVPTAVAPVADVRLPADVEDVLFEPRFGVARTDRIAGDQPDRVLGEPGDVALEPVLFGPPESPFLQFDTYYFEAADADATAALAALGGELERVARPVVLGPGDLLVVDNARAAHGRAAFHPAYDGRDRWLKRACAVTDLRRTRPARASARSRVVED